MPRVPFFTYQRPINSRHSFPPQQNRSPSHSPTIHNPPTMNLTTQHLQVFRVNVGDNTIYATLAQNPNPTPHSWIELSMQGHTLSFSAEVEGREIVIILQNPTFIAQVISERIRMAMETHNYYLWMSTVLQPPLSLPFPQLPFYHSPTWEMPLFNPLT